MMRIPASFAALAFLASASVWSAEPEKSLPALIENSLGMPFVLLPAGEFLMGSDETPDTLAQAYPQYSRERFILLSDEAPLHKVRITKPFYMEQSEVTVGQFKRFVQASGYVAESEEDGTGGYGYNARYDPDATERGDNFEGRSRAYSWRNPGFAQGDDHPVVNVTWNDAVAMAQWLTKTEGVTYRLPTEAEWEYAARGGTRTRYSNGDDPQKLLEVGNVYDADTQALWPKWKAYALTSHNGYTFTSPAASFSPNAFGLYDMHGNAWEWVSDWHDDHYYAVSPLDDPQGPASGTVRVRRGGSWHTWALYARSSYRNWNSPETRYPLVGFRLLRETPKPPAVSN